jgi:cytochrome b subunit of formate dehydrogenase
MRILAIVQAFFAAALLLMGLVTLFSIGITGLIMLVPAGVFAATAGAVSTGSRAAVLLALAADSVLAVYAAFHLPGARLTEQLVPGSVVALVLLAFVAVLLDWRTVKAGRWFEGP